jgi:hypothetical protein
MRWGKKKKGEDSFDYSDNLVNSSKKPRNANGQRPELFDSNAPDTPHIERKTRVSSRRVVVTNGQRKREAHFGEQKRRVAEYKSRRVLLAEEYNRNSKPNYDPIFDFPPPPPQPKPLPLPPPPNNFQSAPNAHYSEMEADLRGVIRHVLGHGMTYEQIKAIVVSEVRYHQSLTKQNR